MNHHVRTAIEATAVDDHARDTEWLVTLRQLSERAFDAHLAASDRLNWCWECDDEELRLTSTSATEDRHLRSHRPLGPHIG